jgi:hypothetical protein
MPTTLINIHHKVPYDVYIGRGKGPWGNPYSHMENTLAEYKVATREEAVEKYREYIMGRPELLARLPELKDKVLGCFCKEQPGRLKIACHGDVLIELVDKL